MYVPRVLVCSARVFRHHYFVHTLLSYVDGVTPPLEGLL